MATRRLLGRVAFLACVPMIAAPQIAGPLVSMPDGGQPGHSSMGSPQVGAVAPELEETNCSFTVHLGDISPKKVVLELSGASFPPRNAARVFHHGVCPVLPWPAAAACSLFSPRPEYRPFRTFRASRLIPIGGGDFMLHFPCRLTDSSPRVRIRVMGKRRGTRKAVWYRTPWADLASADSAILSPMEATGPHGGEASRRPVADE